jgi:hypothetical protein
MTACPPSVGQALLPYPQYCDALQGLNENQGDSIYHSFQVKAERRFTKGMFMLVSYTAAKLLTDASDNTQRAATTWNASQGVISPFERARQRSLVPDDVPQIISATFVYELPIGKNKRYFNSGIGSGLLGGWQVSTIFRASKGTPYFFRSGQCTVSPTFREGCIPGIKTGVNPFVQDIGKFDPSHGPLFDVNAFERLAAFSQFGYAGTGARVTNLRGQTFTNQDFSVIKNTRIKEKVNFQFRAEFFNMWNLHYFINPGGFNITGNFPFNTDISSPNFGKWTGDVSAPRTIQLGARIEF